MPCSDYLIRQCRPASGQARTRRLGDEWSKHGRSDVQLLPASAGRIGPKMM
jgi:hypothetical protein